MTTRGFRFIDEAFSSSVGHKFAGFAAQILYVLGATIIIIFVLDAFYSSNIRAGLFGLLGLGSGVAALEWFAMGWERSQRD